MDEYLNEMLIESAAEAEWLDDWLFAQFPDNTCLPSGWLNYLDACCAFYQLDSK